VAPVKPQDYLRMQTVMYRDNDSIFTGWSLTGSVLALWPQLKKCM